MHRIITKNRIGTDYAVHVKTAYRIMQKNWVK